MIGILAGLTLLLPQGGSGTPAGSPATRPFGGMQLNEMGWPVLPEGAARRTTSVAGKPAAEHPAPPAGETRLPLESSLRDVFATVANPATFRALGGVQVWWRVHLYGSQGETVGMLEITQEADLTAPERDRLEFPDERIYGRYGATVSVRRHGMPWPSSETQARQELDLFAVLLRMPWDFADTSRYAVLPAETAERDGEPHVRIPVLRMSGASGEIGPTPQPRPADRYELWCLPGSMLPRELVYRRADAGVQRRMLLEDWREIGGVRMSCRRILVDPQGRRTAVLEVLRIEPGREATERDFLRR